MILQKFDRIDWITSTLIALAVAIYFFSTSYLIGLVRDEGFYMNAAQNYAGWYQFAADSFGKGEFSAPFSKRAVDRYFEFNNEHPQFIKLLFGLSHFVFYQKLKIVSFVESTRLVSCVFAALLSLLLYTFGRLFFSRAAAIAAPFFFFTMPHIFFHTHLACFDMPVQFFWSGTFILWAIYLAGRSKKIAVIFAVFFGLAMATKHNVYFIPPLLMLSWLFFHFFHYRQLEPRFKGFAGFFRAIPLPLWLIPLISLPVCFAFWPWMWYDTVVRFGSYLHFHTTHVNYTNYYFGKELTTAPFPFSFPWAMTFFTTPTPQLVAFFAGIGLFAVSVIKRSSESLTRQIHADFLMGALFPIFLIALPSVPIFGGIKHWYTGYPIMLTAGLFVIFEGLKSLLSSWSLLRQRLAMAATGVAVVLCLIPANITYAQHGAGYYNELIGGAQGAATNYMQRNFWGYDIMPTLSALNKNAPRGARVFIMSYAEGLNPSSFEYLKKEGWVRKDLQGVNELKDADFAFFFYEKQNESVLYNIYKEFGTSRPLAVSEADGVLFSALFRRLE